MADLRETIAAVRSDGRSRDCRCPAHEDARASLSVSRGRTQPIALYCHAQCAPDDVLAAAGLSWADVCGERERRHNNSTPEIVATYDYTDEAGKLLYQVCRMRPKDFRQRRPDGAGGWTWKLGDARRVLYRLPDVRQQTTVYVVEGEKDADRLAALGIAATTNAGGAGKWRNDYTAQLVAAGVQQVIVLPDHDEPGRQHAETAAHSCRAAGLDAQIVTLPGLPPKGDVSDWLDAGHTIDELVTLTAAPKKQTTVTLTEVDATFRRWLGPEYELDALHVVLAAAAAEGLDGDPCWLLVISGPGNAKTETVQALAGAGAILASTISSEGALLSATSKREQAKDAHGGLLRQIGDRGLLVVKDVTSVLSMNRDSRSTLLAALREIHDGYWTRHVGTDGGRSLHWHGRIVVVGACTTAWDRAHDVISTMGDRFVVVRMDSAHTPSRFAAGRRAIANTGREVMMRAELSAAVGGLLAGITGTGVTLTEDEQTRILEAANVVTLARTGVDYDYRGDVIDAHAPEAPTRFAKELAQVLRGAVAIGVHRAAALRLAIRCARDSMPPIRLAILDDVSRHPSAATKDVRQRLGKPRATVDRQLQALHMLGVLTCDEEDAMHRGQAVTLWRYRLADGIDPDVLDPNSVPDLSPHGHVNTRRETESLPTNKSGTERARGMETDDADAARF